MEALNFYSPIVADQLRSGRKTATIRRRGWLIRRMLVLADVVGLSAAAAPVTNAMTMILMGSMHTSFAIMHQ